MLNQIPQVDGCSSKNVCLVSVLLAPKLVFYTSTNELLFTNFKDAAYSSRP